MSSGLDLAKEGLRSSWWTLARRYRNSSGRLFMGLQEKQLLLSEARTRAADGGEVKTFRGGAVGDAGAEVTKLFWLKLACLYTQVQALGSTNLIIFQ